MTRCFLGKTQLLNSSFIFNLVSHLIKGFPNLLSYKFAKRNLVNGFSAKAPYRGMTSPPQSAMSNGKCQERLKALSSFPSRGLGMGVARWQVLIITAHGLEYLLQARHCVHHFPYISYYEA